MNALRKMISDDASSWMHFSNAQLDDYIDVLIKLRENNCSVTKIQHSGIGDDWKIKVDQGHYECGTLHGKVGISVYTDDTDTD